ncbi:putative nuclease [Toxoplasma gondii VAND]|uniref:Putative nuclease n=1 Tax=Toxoplasma gondii VAND TaxID=933077 RepID=A0A086PH13_TOXGO|nr:putative nuclease [Toxoplasma gondii VAND]
MGRATDGSGCRPRQFPRGGLSGVLLPCLLSSTFLVCLASLVVFPFFCRQEEVSTPPASVGADASVGVPPLKGSEAAADDGLPSTLSADEKKQSRDCGSPRGPESSTACSGVSPSPSSPPSGSLSSSTELSSRFFSPHAVSLAAYSAYLPVQLQPRPPTSAEVLEALEVTASVLSLPANPPTHAAEAKGFAFFPYFSRASSPGSQGGRQGASRKPGAYFVCLVVVVMDGDGFRCVEIADSRVLAAHVGDEFFEKAAERRTAAALSSPYALAFALSTLSVLLPVRLLFAAAAAPANSGDSAVFPPYQQRPWAGRCRPLSRCTVVVRLAAIDAPETAKRGSEAERPKLPRSGFKQKGAEGRRSAAKSEADAPNANRVSDVDAGGQPFGVAAAARLASEVLGRVVLVKDLGKDQYGRTLARVFRVAHEASFVAAVQAAMKEAVRGALAPGGKPREKHKKKSVEEKEASKPREKEKNVEEKEEQEEAAEAYEPGTSGRRLSVKRSRRQRSGGVSAAGVAAFAGGVAVGLMKTRADAFKHQVQQKVVNGEAGSRELAAQIFVEEVLEKNMKEVADVLLSEGLAVVYTQGGAKFDGRRSKFLAIEREARERKLGFWGIPEDARETPAEYKKRKRSE